MSANSTTATISRHEIIPKSVWAGGWRNLLQYSYAAPFKSSIYHCHSLASPFTEYDILDDLLPSAERDAAPPSTKPSAATWPHGVLYSSIVHRECEAGAHLIHHFWIVVEHSFLPPAWKESRISPLLKPGRSPLNKTSFRPVAPGSYVGKVMNVWFLLDYNGFWKNRISLLNVCRVSNVVVPQLTVLSIWLLPLGSTRNKNVLRPWI